MPRPRLAPGADTNDPNAYFVFAGNHLRRDERQAAAAYYWAMRLDPTCAGCAYGRAIALLIEDGPRLEGYFFGHRNYLRSARYQAFDSLVRRAMVMDPFLHRRLDLHLLASMYDLLDSDGWERDLDGYLVEADSSLAALVYYSRGRFDLALRVWARMMERRPHAPLLRVARARTFFLTGQLDSAGAMMSEALRIERRRDVDSASITYESKTLWEYAMGRIHHSLGRLDSAQQAYERALIEDLAFAPAHHQLAVLHLERLDTTSALRELARAVSVGEREFLPRLTYGILLASTGSTDSALVHLRRAIELEPWAARPRLILGAVLDSDGDRAGAADAFEQWLARAPRTDPNVAGVRARVANLRRN